MIDETIRSHISDWPRTYLCGKFWTPQAQQSFGYV